MEEPFQPGDKRPHDDTAFWQELQETFETALDLLQEVARAHGIDPASVSPEEISERQDRLDEAVRSHSLACTASEYVRSVNNWFRDAQDGIHEWGRNVTRAADVRAVGPDLEKQVTAMQEAVEAIAAERHRIHVKLLRALRERLRHAVDAAPAIESKTLSPTETGHGSAGEDAAGEALAGVQRSIEMWLRLRDFFPEEEDTILDLLVLLEHLKNDIGETFSPENHRAREDDA